MELHYARPIYLQQTIFKLNRWLWFQEWVTSTPELVTTNELNPGGDERTSNERSRCPIVFTFRSVRSNRVVHVLIHLDVKNVPCTVCIFHSLQRINRHLLSWTDNTLFLLLICIVYWYNFFLAQTSLFCFHFCVSPVRVTKVVLVE